MLINTPASALPTETMRSNEAAPASAVLSNAMLAAASPATAARPLAGFGPGVAACAGAWIGGGYPAGTAGGAGTVTGGHVLGYVGVVKPPKVRFNATSGSNVQSTVQHNTMTRLIPVRSGGVGPHPAREKAPA
jgi:hypothetical protein